MKTRIISGSIGIALLVGLMFLINTPVFSIAVALLALVAVHEILGVAKVENKIIHVVACIFSAAVPIAIDYDLLEKFNIQLPTVLIPYTLVILVLMLVQYEKTRFEHAVIAMFSSLAVPFAFSVLIMLRDFHETATDYTSKHSLFFIIFGLCCAWITDTFAYFVGKACGKHKLSPKISPKKSIEGAIGGLVCTALFNTIIVVIFNHFVFESNPISVWFVIPVSLVLSVISMFGDLSASVIKRNYGAKDYGKIMPGHGGVMDRFDSCLFTLPALYFILSFLK